LKVFGNQQVTFSTLDNQYAFFKLIEFLPPCFAIEVLNKYYDKLKVSNNEKNLAKFSFNIKELCEDYSNPFIGDFIKKNDHRYIPKRNIFSRDIA